MGALAARVASRERRAVAEAVTCLERNGAPGLAALAEALKPHLNGIAVIGITGPPGAGKSTLVNALVKTWRAAGRRIAVIAVDPSSPVSGGAILGDRIRMTAALDDDGVFVRSLSSAGHLGGLSPAAVRIIDVFDAAAFDLVVLETVGTGQSEIDIAQVADTAIVVAAPGLGDGIQAMKSGLLEIADIIVVNKADRPDARETAEQLAAAVTLRAAGGFAPPILQTTATQHTGIDDLVTAVDEATKTALAGGGGQSRRARRARYVVERLAVERVRGALTSAPDDLIDDLLSGRIRVDAALRTILETTMEERR